MKQKQPEKQKPSLFLADLPTRVIKSGRKQTKTASAEAGRAALKTRRKRRTWWGD